ncbi:MAG: T9SS type A sorting domain-containing protein, partial [Candidatus Zixiibacteriota bacterium]
SIDVRGDINLNGVANEIADAVMFTNYFVYNLTAFGDHVEGSIAASDVNADGIPLTVADLVYMVRIITADAMPYEKLSPGASEAAVHLSVNHSAAAVSVNSPEDIGGGYFVFEHSGYEIGEPHLINGASDMTLKYSDENDLLKVLVYSMEDDIRIKAGSENIFVIPIEGRGAIELSEVQLSDYHGNLLTVDKSDRAVLPRHFALHQNYPNPFNAVTQIIYELPQASHVKIEIRNIMGQRVATLIDKVEDAGVHRVQWDGLDQSGSEAASGIYIYRLEVDDFVASKKMTLLK